MALCLGIAYVYLKIPSFLCVNVFIFLSELNTIYSRHQYYPVFILKPHLLVIKREKLSVRFSRVLTGNFEKRPDLRGQ